MKIDIYTSTKDGEKYLSVIAGVKLETLKLTDTMDPDTLSLSPFRTRLEIDSSKPHKALNVTDILKQIESNGFALHGAKTRITLTTKKNPKAKSKIAKQTTSKTVAKKTPVKTKKKVKTVAKKPK